MSNRRRPAWGNDYRAGYLRSRAWFSRRDRWFKWQVHQSGQLRCALCLLPGTRGTLELHHLDYRGVLHTDFGWEARERHRDLTALHPWCHEAVHQLIDRDQALAGLASRRAASIEAMRRLRGRLASLTKPEATR